MYKEVAFKVVDEAEGYGKGFAGFAGASSGGGTWEAVGCTVYAAWGLA